MSVESGGILGQISVKNFDSSSHFVSFEAPVGVPRRKMALLGQPLGGFGSRIVFSLQFMKCRGDLGSLQLHVLCAESWLKRA